MTGLTATSMFTVGAEDKHDAVSDRSIAAKFLINPLTGDPIQDPVPGGSQRNHIYVNGITMPGSSANPNNWLIVPANYSIANSEAFAAQVTALIDSRILATDPDTDAAGVLSALGLMMDSFVQGGSQDLQRNSAWGIPPGLVVPAFVDAASYHLGLVTGLSGLPMTASEVGGGLENLFHSHDNALMNKVTDTLHFYLNLHPTDYTVDNTGGPFWLSIDNAENIKAGFQFAQSMSKSRSSLQSKKVPNSATPHQTQLSPSGFEDWVLSQPSNQAAKSFQQGTDDADEWSIDGADFLLSPINLPGIGSGADEGKEPFNLNSSPGNTHTPDPAGGKASHKSSDPSPPRPAGHHTMTAFDMIDAYENLLPYISLVPMGDGALDLGAQPVPAAMRFNDRMIEIGKEILAAEHEKARSSLNGDASAKASLNGRPRRGAQEVPDSLEPNAHTVALAAALYKAIHKEIPAPPAQVALTHRNAGPTGRRDDPIIIYRSDGL